MGGAALGAGLLWRSAAEAYPLDGILGLQSFDIRQQLTEDYAGTLHTLSGWGYKALDLVHPAQTGERSASEVRQLLDSAGMVCHNCHFNYKALTEDYAQTMAYGKTLGIKSLICQTAGRIATADGWKKMADDLNAIGKKTKGDGILTGFHNHGAEFKEVDGQIPFDLLINGTDPQLVRFQIDVGNLAETGKDPLHYLVTYPNRYFSMHAKDVKDGKIGVALGEGSLDFKKLFAAAKADGIHDYDVETGAPASVVMEKLRLSIEYLKKLTI
jgi:sugar phosphate isomerase/epimerase